MTTGKDRLAAIEALMKDGYTRGQAKSMTFWMSMPFTSMADVAKSEPTRQYRLHANKYPQEPPLRCLPGEWRYVFETYPENASATYQAMWAYFFEVADMLRERAEQRASVAEGEAEIWRQLAAKEIRRAEEALADAELRIEELEDENADWYYGHKQQDSQECAKFRFQHAQDVEVIRSLQEQLKEKDEEITALRHCVDDEQANVARSKEAFLNMQQKFIQAQATILELRKPQRYEQPCVYPYPMGHR